MAPINLMMTVEKGGQVLMTNDAWEDIEFEVALDSGQWSMFAPPTTARTTCSRILF